MQLPSSGRVHWHRSLTHVQGIGRHSFEYVLERIDKALGACNALLAEGGPYMLGATPTSADLFLFAIVESVRLVLSIFVRCVDWFRGTSLLR